MTLARPLGYLVSQGRDRPLGDAALAQACGERVLRFNLRARLLDLGAHRGLCFWQQRADQAGVRGHQSREVLAQRGDEAIEISPGNFLLCVDAATIIHIFDAERLGVNDEQLWFTHIDAPKAAKPKALSVMDVESDVPGRTFKTGRTRF